MAIAGSGSIYLCTKESDTESNLANSEKLEWGYPNTWGQEDKLPTAPDNKTRLIRSYMTHNRYKAQNPAPETNESHTQDTGKLDPIAVLDFYFDGETGEGNQAKGKNLISNWIDRVEHSSPVFPKGRFGLRVDSNTCLNGAPRPRTHEDDAAGFKIIKAEPRVEFLTGAHVATLHVELQWVGTRVEIPV
ncbi:MAG: hypothetical protein K8823_1522 [Cenarchaeum symbiont of Oopsacas minuta]|nr:hypothetical protein [Cenarchaeum symbiont of Oopsacas minuta]